MTCKVIAHSDEENPGLLKKPIFCLSTRSRKGDGLRRAFAGLLEFKKVASVNPLLLFFIALYLLFLTLHKIHQVSFQSLMIVLKLIGILLWNNECHY